MDFQQSKTYQNLQNMLERKLMISTLFNIYSDKAVQEGFVEIGNIFSTTAVHEKEHARICIRKLNNNMIPDTQANLSDAINLDTETSNLCRNYAITAKEEGYADIAAILNGIANIELNHNLAFRSQYDNILRQEVFCKPQEALWICMQCGNIMAGECAPKICPVCSYPQGYYRVYSDSIT